MGRKSSESRQPSFARATTSSSSRSKKIPQETIDESFDFTSRKKERPQEISFKEVMKTLRGYASSLIKTPPATAKITKPKEEIKPIEEPLEDNKIIIELEQIRDEEILALAEFLTEVAQNQEMVGDFDEIGQIEEKQFAGSGPRRKDGVTMEGHLTNTVTSVGSIGVHSSSIVTPSLRRGPDHKLTTTFIKNNNLESDPIKSEEITLKFLEEKQPKAKAVAAPTPSPKIIPEKENFDDVFARAKTNELKKTDYQEEKLAKAYKILGISRGSSPQEISTIYRKIMRVVHPDKNPQNSVKAKEVSQIVSHAYEIVR